MEIEYRLKNAILVGWKYIHLAKFKSEFHFYADITIFNKENLKFYFIDVTKKVSSFCFKKIGFKWLLMNQIGLN